MRNYPEGYFKTPEDVIKVMKDNQSKNCNECLIRQMFKEYPDSYVVFRYTVITFKEPLGNSRGDWKGGAVRRDADITESEVRNGNIITPLRRYEKKVNETKEFD